MWNVFKGNNNDTRTRSLLRSGFFIVDFEHIWHVILVFSLLPLNKQMLDGTFQENLKSRIPAKSGNVTCLVIQKAFKNTQVFQRKLLDCTRIKTIFRSNIQNTVRI